ncbi:MAG: hypothetical protein F6K24_50935 [Okeania sp. SIO2D1]|nr:hypothetical protein [Okeania sp. SIO2D1]
MLQTSLPVKKNLLLLAFSNIKSPEIIELTEYRHHQFLPDKIDYDLATKLWQKYDLRDIYFKIASASIPPFSGYCHISSNN